MALFPFWLYYCAFLSRAGLDRVNLRPWGRLLRSGPTIVGDRMGSEIT